MGTPPPDCPPDRFVVGVGSSRHGRADAEARARVAVSRSISSTLKAETERLSAATRVDERFSSDQRVLQIIHEGTEFAHAELIRVIGAPETQDGEVFVLACLNRAEASARITAAAESDVRSLESAMARADAAAGRGDRIAFAGAWRETRIVWDKVFPLFLECRAIEGRVCAVEEQLRAEKERLASEAAHFRGAVAFTLSVTPGDLPEDMLASVSDVFHKALATIGPTHRGTACEAELPGLLYVEIEPRGHCGWGTLGHTCRPEYRIRAVDCIAPASRAEASLTGTDLVAADPRDAARALRLSVARLTLERARTALRDALSVAVPF